MKLQSWGAAALMLCAVLSDGARLQARQQRDEGGKLAPRPGQMAEEMEQAEFAPYGEYDSCQTCSNGSCSTCCSSGGGGGGLMGGLLNRPIQLVAGAEFIYARPNFSQALAFISQTPGVGETWHCYDFDYDETYGFYGGLYMCDCGGALMFNYRRLTGDATFAADDNANTNIFGPFEVDGDITGQADVDLQSYDATFSKTIPLGCALSCATGCGDCCDDCCDPCCGEGCGWCPAWDITWSGGIRFADAEWSRGAQTNALLNGAPLNSYVTRFNWDGFGGKIGLMGRRYFGRRGLASIYAKGDWSVLFGEYDITTFVTNAGNTSTLRSSCENIVPVTEIELGGTVHLGAHASLSAGYFWAAWHDLGMREEFDFDRFQISHYDDANILGFDGLFARAEVAF